MDGSEEQARATREAALEMAHRIEDDARGRSEQLREEVRSLEERRGRVLDDLRELVAQFTGLVPELGGLRREPELLEALEVDRRS